MLPVQVTIRDMHVSPALEDHIRKKASKLNRFYDRISSCRIVVELPQKHKQQGKLFNVRIDITVPGKELVVTHKYDEDIYIAIRDAFEAIERQLEDHSHKRKGNVKTHEELVKGNIVRLMPNEGYGFIEGLDGNEYYFSLTNVRHPKFQQLLIGDYVHFIPVVFAEGRQAHHVVREKNHNGKAVNGD